MLTRCRAAKGDRPTPETDEVSVPTRVIWGVHDQFLKRRMAYDSVDYCADGRVTTFQEATHWVQHEQPMKVADAIVDELA